MPKMRSKIPWSFAVLAPLAIAFGAETKYEIHGQAWMDYGRIISAEDTITNTLSPDNTLNYNGNGMQSLGAQFTVNADLSDNLEAAFGFGAYKASHALGSGQYSYMTISLFQNFVTQSRLTWYTGEKAAPTLSATVGGFPYNYNPDVKNLGMYLLRGPVYPGIIMGGYGDFATDSTKGTMLGLKFHQGIGNFTQDLILNSERDIPPTFDWSLAYFAKYKMGPLQLGAGVNFYRLIPYNSALETPGKDTNLVKGSARARYIEVDNSNPAAPDTTFFTHQGTKVIGTLSLDLKSLFGGSESMNPDDLKLYAEGGVIGVTNYGKAYSKIAERAPVMVGFNFPTFGLLNHLSLEVEYYGAKYRNDLALIGNNNVVADWTTQDHALPSPKPVTNADYGIDSLGYFRLSTGDSVYVRGTAMDKDNVTKDNLKWSVYIDKVVSQHVQFVAQVANDHFRPRPVASGLIHSEGGTAEVFASPKDWYFMLRVGYFF
jgi:hypothetical protein